ncbi:MAG: sugar phosphate isomerase/epimerase [Spirochaetes bacterium]|nr:MAG: sugar phosphate isomerase/epimerase [Spirochaetota bacterium]
MAHTYPKLHNAAWPGLVGKGEDSEPVIDFETMVNLTAAAEVNGQKFDGIDVFLSLPHIDIDSSDDELKKVANLIKSKNLSVGSMVAPIWPPSGGPAFGSETERKQFLDMVKKSCIVGKKFNDLGVRSYGIIRIDTAGGTEDWSKDPVGNQKKSAATFTEACNIAESYGERLAVEGEICWGGIHGWKPMIELFEMVGRPKTLGFQADMAHTLLYMLGYNAEDDALVGSDFDWSKTAFDAAYKKLTDKLRPWTIDFHIAQNDATVFGSGSHDKTGRHCQVTDPKGKLDVPYHAGFWMNEEDGKPTKAFKHICWDGCMFPNKVMMEPKTWNDILGAMVEVRNRHGWD